MARFYLYLLVQVVCYNLLPFLSEIFSFLWVLACQISCLPQILWQLELVLLNDVIHFLICGLTCNALAWVIINHFEYDKNVYDRMKMYMIIRLIIKHATIELILFLFWWLLKVRITIRHCFLCISIDNVFITLIDWNFKIFVLWDKRK